MRDHPDRETLQQFISGQLASEDARLTDRHLAVCSECRDRADEVSGRLALQLLDSWVRPSYDEAFERAADQASGRLAIILAEDRNTKDLLADLLKVPAEERRRKIAEEEVFRTPKFSQFLRARSREMWISDPHAASHLADLAVEVALHLDMGRYGSSLVEDCRALAWAYLGNTYRITSDLWRAEQAVRQAWLHHVRAGEDALTETELLSITISLRSAQESYDEALKLSDRAIAIYREAHDRHMEGSMLIKKANSLVYQGRGKEAVPIIRAGLERIDPDQDPRLLLAGQHNLINAFCRAGEPQKAYEMLQRGRTQLRDASPMDVPRLKWLEGQILTGLGKFHSAERSLCEAREFFLDHQIGIEVALVSWHLAEVYVEHGRWRQAKDVLRDVIALSEAFGLRSKAFMARLMYWKVSQG